MSEEWDLESDGDFDDASGPRASRTFDAGVYTVSLRVTDDRGAVAQAARTFKVCPAKGGPKACRD